MCKLCETKPVYEFTNKRKLCARCFVRWFQKKFLYVIRRFKMIGKNDIIGYRNSNNFRDVVLEDVLKMFANKTNIKLIELPSKRKINKISISDTIDLESDKIVNEVIKGDLKKIKNFKPFNKKIIKPLYLFLDKEVLLYAKLRKLKIKKGKFSYKNNIDKFINKLETKHPEVKRAIINSFLKLQ